MGTLNQIFQLKPIVLSVSAVLKVKSELEDSFEQKFNSTPIDTELRCLFSDTFVCKTNDGRVERLSIHAPSRILELIEPGIYIVLQSDCKWGFDEAFIKGMHRLASFMEDCLFFHIYEQYITRYEIKDGALHIQESDDFNPSDYEIDKYIYDHYKTFPKVIAAYYLDKAIELKLFIDDLITYNQDDMIESYDSEDFEKLLKEITRYQNYIKTEDFLEFKLWLQKQITEHKMKENI